MAAAALSPVSGRFTPDVALLELAVTALHIACPAGAEPLEYEGLRERYLPEVAFRGRVEHRNSQYALYAAACMRGGLQPDLPRDAGWCQSRGTGCGSSTAPTGWPATCTPAVASRRLRRLRRRRLQPSRRRAPQGPGGRDRSADRRSARPR